MISSLVIAWQAIIDAVSVYNMVGERGDHVVVKLNKR